MLNENEFIKISDKTLQDAFAIYGKDITSKALLVAYSNKLFYVFEYIKSTNNRSVRNCLVYFIKQTFNYYDIDSRLAQGANG